MPFSCQPPIKNIKRYYNIIKYMNNIISQVINAIAKLLINAKLASMIKNKLSEMMGIRRMNMAETARIAGLSHVAVFKIYHNKTKTIELETINKLCYALNCRIQDIFEYIPD